MRSFRASRGRGIAAWVVAFAVGSVCLSNLRADETGSGKVPGKDPSPQGKESQGKEKEKEKPKSKKGDPEDAKEKDPEKDGPDDGDGTDVGNSKPLSIDEQYVRDNLERLLHASEMEFQSGGRVKLVFDFTVKNHEQEPAFIPNIGDGIQGNFRWTVDHDESWKSYTNGKKDPVIVGVKAVNSGNAFLNCWFEDDLEVAVEFSLAATFAKTQSFALVFSSEKNQAVGTNCGSQAATFTKGKPTKTQGTVDPLVFKNVTQFKLKVRGGTFECFRDKRSKQKMKYEPKELSSGRVGFIWSGGLSGVLNRVEVVGRIDLKKMAKVIRESVEK